MGLQVTVKNAERAPTLTRLAEVCAVESSPVALQFFLHMRCGRRPLLLHSAHFAYVRLSVCLSSQQTVCHCGSLSDQTFSCPNKITSFSLRSISPSLTHLQSFSFFNSTEPVIMSSPYTCKWGEPQPI